MYSLTSSYPIFRISTQSERTVNYSLLVSELHSRPYLCIPINTKIGDDRSSNRLAQGVGAPSFGYIRLVRRISDPILAQQFESPRREGAAAARNEVLRIAGDSRDVGCPLQGLMNE